MLKHLFALLAFVGLCTTASAQFSAKMGLKDFKGAKVIAKGAVQGSKDFSYLGMTPDEVSTDMNDKMNVQYGTFGLGESATSSTAYYVAIFIPKAYAGKQISGLKFFMPEVDNIENLQIWANTTRPSLITGTKVRKAVDNPVDYTNGYNDVQFGTTYTVPTNGCYVGFYFVMKNNTDQYPVFIKTDGKTGSMYMKTTSPTVSWTDIGGQYNYSCLLWATLTGEFNENIATFTSNKLDDSYAVANQESTVSATIQNSGLNTINSISYTITDNTTQAVSEEYTANMPENGISTFGSATVDLTIPAITEPGDYAKTITITKVNGADNEATSSNTSAFNLFVRSKLYPRTVVVEEATATGCAPCSRGHAAFEAIDDKYGDKVINIGAHITGINYWDPMYCADYTGLTNTASGVPTAWVNRKKVTDVYFGNNNQLLGIFDYLDAELKKYPEATVSCKANWNEDETAINVTSYTEFCINQDVANYAVAYALLGEDLRDPIGPIANADPESNWYQNDAYYGYNYYEDEPYLHNWETRTDIYKWVVESEGQTYTMYLATDVAYKHVALKAISISQGVTGSIKSPIVSGETQRHSTVFSIPNGITASRTGNNDNLLQDKNNLYVVAMLIDRSSGNIVNAAKTHVISYTDGITNATADTEADAQEVARYTADGRKVSAPVKGLNIVKMANGKTVKVVVE